MKIRIIVFITVLTAGVLSFLIWFHEQTLPVNQQNPQTKIFVIKKGESVRTIAKNLKKEGLIRGSLAFFILVKQKGIEKNIQAGDFRLSTAMNANEIASELQHGTLDVWITIPEGWRNEEIALKLAESLHIPEKEFLAYAKEGYMFPDTYLFPKDASASAVAAKMRETFDKKITKRLEKEIAQSSFSLDEIVILASMIERESFSNKERPYIASVMINRLNNDMALNIDATVQYALGYQPNEKDWWKDVLTKEDLQIDSPYNTYKYKGLPPGPISNPGLISIQAILHPAQSDYMYYLHDKDGVVHFAKTFEEHQSNINTYLKK